MFRVIRQFVFRIRVFLGAIRSGVLGLVIVLGAWIFLAPPSETEASLLDLPPQNGNWNPELRTHRMAKILTVVGSDRIYEIVATSSGTGLTAADVRRSVNAVAAGEPSQVAITAQSVAIADPSRLAYIDPDATTDIDEIQKNAVRAGGAKFVTARTD